MNCLQDTTLEEAIEFLRQTTGVTLLLQLMSTTLVAQHPLRCPVVCVSVALRWITQLTRLQYSPRSRAVYISPKAPKATRSCVFMTL